MSFFQVVSTHAAFFKSRKALHLVACVASSIRAFLKWGLLGGGARKHPVPQDMNKAKHAENGNTSWGTRFLPPLRELRLSDYELRLSAADDAPRRPEDQAGESFVFHFGGVWCATLVEIFLL